MTWPKVKIILRGDAGHRTGPGLCRNPAPETAQDRRHHPAHYPAHPLPAGQCLSLSEAVLPGRGPAGARLIPVTPLDHHVRVTRRATTLGARKNTPLGPHLHPQNRKNHWPTVRCAPFPPSRKPRPRKIVSIWPSQCHSCKLQASPLVPLPACDPLDLNAIFAGVSAIKGGVNDNGEIGISSGGNYSGTPTSFGVLGADKAYYFNNFTLDGKARTTRSRQNSMNPTFGMTARTWWALRSTPIRFTTA